jgi:hypothetical protein
MQRASTAKGDPRGHIRDRRRSIGRRVLIIGRQARSPETRAALVQSYRHGWRPRAPWRATRRPWCGASVSDCARRRPPPRRRRAKCCADSGSCNRW